MGEVLAWLVGGLQGRVWDGKEELLRAVAVVCKECPAAVDAAAVG